MKYLALIVLAGCGADVPENPTYFADVQPLLRANCVRCHGADPSDPKIAKFRLDRYVKDDTTTFDVYDYASGTDPAMMRVAVDLESPAMPPDYTLTDRQRDILARWIAQGAPKGTRNNHAPQIELIAPTGTATADQTLDTTFRAWDEDLDGLAVQLWAHDAGTGEDIPLGAATGGGVRTLFVDTGTLASKHSFEIYATLDDGFADDPALDKTRVTLIPQVLVDHGLRGTAPTVRLVTPNGGDTLIGSTQITWTATDPDVDAMANPDVLTIDLALVKYAADGTELGTEPIATGIANTGSFADAEGLVKDSVEYAKVTGPPSCNLASGCAAMTIATWKPVTMTALTGTSQAQSFSWSTPAEGSGCYCVRGTVTDSATQSTTVVAAKPVRF